MSDQGTCPKCGGSLTTSPDVNGMCPVCLFGLALAGANEQAPEGWFGPYRMVRLIGEGGMGMVYLAEQTAPIQRVAAVKVIKLGMDSRAVIARFETERQVLASLEHPGIAHVYDAGSTPDGRPYFAMEYVEGGIPITDYADRIRLPIRQRLDLFCEVCEAVDYAHRKGVVHRDLKPSNILVTVRGGKAACKIIDFGLARAAKPSIGEQALSLYTETGALIGTPEYMSPEQAGVTREPVGPASDVYSLGVLLYELTTGALPFERPAAEAGYFELLRQIHDVEPRRPAGLFEKGGADADRRAAERGSTRSAIARELRGDIGWIALRAMEKQPARRYASAAELAGDIRRHMRHQPVLAGPPGVFYRAGKLMKRRRRVLGLVAGLAAAALVTASMFVRQQSARSAATQAGYIAAIGAAASDIASAYPEHARARLMACPEGMRGWEWRHLMFRADPVMSRWKAGGAIRDPRFASTFGFSEEGKRVVWHTQTSIEEWVGGAHSTRTMDGDVLCVDAGGSHAAVRSREGRLSIHSLRPFRQVQVVVPPEGEFRCAAFDHSALRLAAGSTEGRLVVWNVRSGAREVDVQAHGAAIRRIRFSADGRTLVTAGADGEIRLRNAQTGALLGILSRQAAPDYALALTPSMRWILFSHLDSAAPEQSGLAFIHSVSRSLLRLYRSRDPITAVDYTHPETGQYAFVNRTGELQVCDGATGCAALSSGRGFLFNSVGFAPGDVVYTGGFDANGPQVQSWDALTRGGTLIAGPAGTVRSLVLLPGGKQLVAGLDEHVELWSSTRGVQQVWGSHTGPVTAVAATPGGALLATASEDGTARLWRGDGSPAGAIACGAPLTSAALSPNGKMLATGSTDGMLRLWDTAAGAEVRRYSPGGAVNAAAFSPSGSTVAAAHRGGVSVWNTTDGSLDRLLRLDGEAAALSVAFSPDGKHLAAGQSAGGEFWIWDLESGRGIALNGHSAPVLSLAYSPDGSRIATGSADRTVRIWDARTNATLLALPGHKNDVRCVAWSPGGEFLVSSGPPVATWRTSP